MSAPFLDAASGELDQWNDRCTDDPVRQHFVVPAIIHLLEKLAPDGVIDIGARSGYLIDRLLRLRPPGSVRLIAVDRDPCAVRYMRARFRGSAVQVIAAAVGDWHRHPVLASIGRGFLHVLSFTALDLSDDALCAAFADVRPGSWMFVVLPDVTEDAAAAGLLGPLMRGETVPIAKVDKFTGKPVPFLARRPDRWLGWAHGAGLTLVSMAEFHTEGHRYVSYLLTAGPEPP